MNELRAGRPESSDKIMIAIAANRREGAAITLAAPGPCTREGENVEEIKEPLPGEPIKRPSLHKVQEPE